LGHIANHVIGIGQRLGGIGLVKSPVVIGFILQRFVDQKIIHYRIGNKYTGSHSKANKGYLQRKYTP
jgi:hypothetical protein